MNKTHSGRSSSLPDLLKRYSGPILIGAVFVLFSVEAETFLTAFNMLQIVHHGSILGLFSLGFTVTVISGEIDLSFSNLGALIGVLVAIFFVKADFGVVVGLLTATLFGIGIGAFNGYIIAYRGCKSLITTIAMSSICWGVTFMLTGGGDEVRGMMPDAFAFIGQGYVGIVPCSVFIFTLCYLISFIIITRLPFGHHLYAIGFNSEVARASGINVRFLKFIAFVISGFLSSVAGLIITSRLGSGQPIVGAQFLLEGIAAAFFGVAISTQDKPSVLGTLQGVLLLSIIFNGVTLLGLPLYLKNIIQGGILVGALVSKEARTLVDVFYNLKMRIDKRHREAVGSRS
jgi:ribose transport system permease protein